MEEIFYHNFIRVRVRQHTRTATHADGNTRGRHRARKYLITEAIVSRLHFGTFRNEILNSLRSLTKMTPDSYVVIHTWSLRGYPKDCDFKSNPNLTPECSATKSNKSEPLIFLTPI